MTDLLARWLHDGLLLDAVIALVAFEALALLAWRRATGRGPQAAALLPNLTAGLALMLALRCALAGAAPAWTLAAMATAGIAHLADLRQRFAAGA